MQTLYTKIGPNRLRTIVDRFYDIVFNDSTIAYLFNTDKSLIRNKQYQFLTHFFWDHKIIRLLMDTQK